jgi:lipoprotein NlpI
MRLIFNITAFTLLAARIGIAVERESFDDLQNQAKAAYAKAKPEEAILLASRAIAVEPRNPSGYFLRARFHEENREPAKAIADYDQVIKLDSRRPDTWQHRGGEHFKLGHIKESINDFDRFIELVPQQAPYHWQRGIALYYAGRFDEGRKQFELHQTVNPNDVENAVWHFLCLARTNGLEKARSALIPIKSDARVPMMEVHALFANKLKPEDVLKAANSGNPQPAQLKRQLFYAHLYLGLYFEVLGDDPQAREHIIQAVGRYRTDDYMGDVARVHLQLRWPKEKIFTNDGKSP